MLRPHAVAVMLAAIAGCAGASPPADPGATGDAGPEPAPTGPLAALPIEADTSQLPIVRGSINGRPARLLIDTGASATIVSAALLGVAPDRGVRVDLCLGPVCLPQVGVWAADTPFSRPEPDAIQAVVGVNPLARYVLDLDHGRTVTLWAPEVAPADGCRAPAQTVHLDGEGRPLLDARLDGGPLGLVLLDTGARYSLLDGDAAASSAYLDEGAMETGACSIDGCTTGGSFVSVARRLCAGDHCLDDVEVKYPAWNAIGGSFLRRVRLILDLARPSARFCD